MNKYKVCFWLNVPSNHQTLFLEALKQDDKIDVEVRYFSKPSEERLKLGWRDEHMMYDYEQYVYKLDDALKSLPDWKDRIHIVIGYSYSFNRTLIPILIKNNVKWVHWSERYGYSLAKKLHYNMILFKLLRPVFLLTKRSYGKLINKYAFGCFAQGELSQHDFISMGVNKDKIENLYYTTETLSRRFMEPEDLKRFPYKYKFFYAGRLNKRKGIEDLLVAFSKLMNAEQWGLVLLGNDETNGYFHKVSKKLGIENSVLFLDNVKTDQISNFFSFINVFILASRFDGWGAVVNEASSIGLPIIASDQCGASFHLIENGKNGFIVGAGKRKEITKAMQKYVSNNELLISHGNHSQIIFKNFTPQINVIRFITALKKWDNMNREKLK